MFRRTGVLFTENIVFNKQCQFGSLSDWPRLHGMLWRLESAYRFIHLILGDNIQKHYLSVHPTLLLFRWESMGLFPSGSDNKESACNAGDPGLIDPLEKGMATHSSILAWRISWTEEPGGLQSMGLQSRTWLTFIFTFPPVLILEGVILPCSPREHTAHVILYSVVYTVTWTMFNLENFDTDCKRSNWEWW